MNLLDTVFNKMTSFDRTMLTILVIMHIIGIYVIFRLGIKAKSSSSSHLLTRPIQYVNLGIMGFMVVGVLMCFENYTTTVLSAFWFIGGAFYNLFWYLALRHYINTIFRVPKRRVKRFKFLPLWFVFVFLLSMLNGILRFQLKGDNGITTLLTLVNLLIELGIFLTLDRLLYLEKKKNSSKITQARITLFQYVVRAQMVLLLILTIVSVLYRRNGGVVTNEITGGFTLGASAAMLLSIIFSFWSVDLPLRIRRLYNLTPRRFEVVKALKAK